MSMEKEKRKSTWKRDTLLIFIVITTFFTFTCGAWFLDSWFGWGNEIGYFAEFETREDVEAFLLEHLEIDVTTYDETFSIMQEYDNEETCHKIRPQYYFTCASTIYSSIRQGGHSFYLIRFNFRNETILSSIEVFKMCTCFPD